MDSEKYKCLITPQAIEDIDETLAYITNELENPDAAKKLFEELEKTFERIALFPYSMAKIRNDDITLGKEYRRAEVNNFVLIYKVTEEPRQVRVMAAFYGPSDVIRRLSERL